MGCCRKNKVNGQIDFIDEDIRLRLAKCRNCINNRWKGMRMWCREHHWYIPRIVKLKYVTCFIGGW